MVYTKEDPAVAVLKDPFNTLLEPLHETPTLKVGAAGVIPPVVILYALSVGIEKLMLSRPQAHNLQLHDDRY